MYTVPGVYGYDISKQAINAAKENAKLNDVPAIFEKQSVLRNISDETVFHVDCVKSTIHQRQMKFRF